ncbi:MAG: TolC family protein [Ignavibacteria bacterium]
MKAIILLFSLFLNTQQDTLHLKDCYYEAEKVYPNRLQANYLSSISRYKIENQRTNYLPQFSLKGQATYQSEVPEININIPMFKPPELSKDRYSLFIDIKETIYDAGTTASLIEIEKKQNIIDNHKIETELFAIRPKVNDIYFSILIIDRKLEAIQFVVDDLEKKLSEAEVKFANAAETKNSINIINAQLFTYEQELQNLKIERQGQIRMLEVILNKTIPETTLFVVPQITYFDSTLKVDNRPEINLFNSQQLQLDEYEKFSFKKKIPKLNLWGQFGFGRPGLNILDNSFKGFYYVGVSLNWSPIDWNAASNESQIYKLSKEVIKKQKETFEQNTFNNLVKLKEDIKKFEQQIETDFKIINTRKEIVNILSSQLTNGIIVPTVYITELTNLYNAMVNLEIHRTQLVQAKVNFLTTKGLNYYEVR